MQVLVTGNSGQIGRYVEVALSDAGHRVIGFDLDQGHDVRDKEAVFHMAAACDAIVHMAAQLPCEPFDASELMTVNLIGTWNVLQAAKKHKINRVVYFSSVNAMGIFMGNRKPDYLPIDDRHPCYPTTSYSVSKRLSEEICRFHAEETGAVIVCLRLPKVVVPDDYQSIRAQWEEEPESEWHPIWEYGAFLDVRDASSAALAALTSPTSGYRTMLLCADDASSTEPSIELAKKLLPGIPLKDVEKYSADPYRTLVYSTQAKEVLGWQPRYRWHKHVEEIS